MEHKFNCNRIKKKNFFYFLYLSLPRKLFKQIVSFDLFKSKYISFFLHLAEQKLHQEIKEREEKYSELDSKLGRLLKRAKHRIQEVQKVNNTRVLSALVCLFDTGA